jgi:hypothetical protein
MRPAIAVFAVTAIAQWLLPLFGIWQQEQVIARGVTVKIRCTAPDPYDPLRGRYLAVRPEESSALVPAGMPARGVAPVPVWATLVTGEDGLARIESLSIEPVSGPTVIRLVAWHSGGANIRLMWPFERFYLNERLAPDADKLVAERFRANKRPVAELRVLDGGVVLVDILIDGVSIRDVVKQQQRP